MNKRGWFTLLLLFGITVKGFSQDSTASSNLKKSYLFLYKTFHKEQYGKHIIKYNPMSTVLFSDPRNATLGYERKINHHQSVSLNVGRFFLPKFIDRDFGAIKESPKKQFGYIVTADYRFYLTKHNVRPVLNGAYIGPFFSVYHNSGGTDFEYVDPKNNNLFVYTASLTNKFTLYNTGFQFGYQFIFWKRISMDLLLFGPSISYYTAELDLESNLSVDQTNAIYEKYYDTVFSKFPLINQLVKSGTFEKSNTSSGLLPNYRYAIQIGYHF